MNAVNLFTPVRQDHKTLELTLRSHRSLKGVQARVYIDDNEDPESSRMLAQEAALDGVFVLPAPDELPDRSGVHQWTASSVDRMSILRNVGMRAASGTREIPRCGFVFTVDADVVCPPSLVTTLLSAQESIVSEVYWTRWPNAPCWLPQVWDRHPYGFLSARSILRLREPGLYRVHGLGACTLIDASLFSCEVLSYDPIDSLRGVLWGEDRWFSVRAECAGFSLWADSYCPPFHIYTADQYDEALAWYEAGAHPGYFRKRWLTSDWDELIRTMWPS